MPDTDDDLTMIISRRLKDAEEKGYQRGLEDGREQTRRQYRDLITATRNDLAHMSKILVDMHQSTVKLVEGIRAKSNESHMVARKPRDMDIVLGVIQRTPGLTGQQLVERCEKEGTPVRERSLRTSLYRLKKIHQIYKQRDGWHASDPALPSLPFHGEAPSGET
jgi:hypothetical protein